MLAYGMVAYGRDGVEYARNESAFCTCLGKCSPMKLESLNHTRIPGRSVALLVNLLAERGLETSHLLASCGLSLADLDNHNLLVTGAQELHVQRVFARAAEANHGLALQAAMRYRILTYNPWGFALATAPTLQVLLEVQDRFADLNYTLAQFRRVADDRGNVGVCLDFTDVPDEIGYFTRCRDSVAFTAFLHYLWGGRFPFSRIEIPLAASDYDAFNFQSSELAETGRAVWLWPAELMASKTPLSDPALHKAYTKECEAILLARGRDALLDKIGALIGKPGGFDLSLPCAARLCNMSDRTLQRELASRRLSFRTLIDSRRRRAAERLLTYSSRSISSIAEELGYSDLSSFHQAFRRWTALGPREFRDRYSASGRRLVGMTPVGAGSFAA